MHIHGVNRKEDDEAADSLIVLLVFYFACFIAFIIR
jgi:hypothetical protein